MTEAETVSRCGFVALMGAPNAGKSTLTNALVGAKVCIVSPKVQTTRARMIAIGLHETSQIVFVDTPGIFTKAQRRLERAMVDAAWAGAENADLRLLLIDAERGRTADTDAILAWLRDNGIAAILVLNKIDLVKRPALLGLAAELNAAASFQDTFMVSALSGDGVEDLRRYLARSVPEGPWLYPEEQLADIPQRLLAAEITREQIFLQLHQELPYAATVETESWKQQRDGSVRIEQVIYVRRDTQKAIVLGKGGRRVQEIGSRSRQHLAEMLGCPVHLFLFVKVRDNWQDDPERYREMGLEFPR